MSFIENRITSAPARFPQLPIVRPEARVEPCAEQIELISRLTKPIPDYGTKIVCSGAILEAVAKHRMTAAMAGVFHYLCSPFGTRSDGSQLETAPTGARLVGLSPDSYGKAYSRLTRLGLVDGDRRVLHGVNLNDWRKEANPGQKAPSGKRSYAKNVCKQFVEERIGNSEGWKMVFRNGIDAILSSPAQWGIYWHAYHLATAHGNIRDKDIERLVEVWYQANRRHTTRSRIMEEVERLVEAGAFRRTGGYIQVLNSAQEDQLVYRRNNSAWALNSNCPAPFTNEEAANRARAKRLHDSRRLLTERREFRRVRTHIPGDAFYGLLYNGMRAITFKPGDSKMAEIKYEPNYLTPEDVDEYIKNMLEFEDVLCREWLPKGWKRRPERARKKKPIFNHLATRLLSQGKNWLTFEPEHFPFAVLCKALGEPVPERVADQLREWSGPDPWAKVNECRDDDLAFDAAAYAVARFGLIDDIAPTTAPGGPGGGFSQSTISYLLFLLKQRLF